MNITLLTYSPNGNRHRWESLYEYGIDVIEHREGHPMHGNGSAAVGALLIDLEGIGPGEASRLIVEVQAQRVCVLVVCDCTESIDGYLNAGADAVVSAIGTSAQTANAIRSAYHQYLVRQQLCRQLETLKCKLEQRKLIGQAMGVIGELLEIPEAEALRRLRHEARNQRRPLHEVAQVVIEAARVMKRDDPRAPMNGLGPSTTHSSRVAKTSKARSRGQGRRSAATASGAGECGMAGERL